MISKQIRKSFLKYFESKKHKIVPSSSVVPQADPTLLFVNAGMNQFKDVFLGKGKRDYLKAVSSQKCIRVGGKHNDLENVGHTTRHLTFFEMLGNFSFGDYFKKEAIEFAWDVTLNIFELDKEKIWASVYKEDDESYELWTKYLPEKRIVRLGEKDNFWSMGETGPCGPCSELLFDRGEKYSQADSPLTDLSGERFFEFWNLVFMESNRDEKGKLSPLPKKCIDTGVGLERVASLKMNVENVFLTDILQGIIQVIETKANRKYDEKDTKFATAFHVIADHIRTLCFAIADGVQPSNIERGYVIRKVLRRAVRYGRVLGFNDPFLCDLVPKVVELMGDDFPELKTSQNRICEVLELEEISFIRTLHKGGSLLGQIIEDSKKASQKISGEDAFRLKDTYGFPIEEVLLIAKDSDLIVDLDSYQKLEDDAKTRSRQAQKKSSSKLDESLIEELTQKNKPTKFVGYDKASTDAKIIAIIRDNQFVEKLSEGEEGLIFLDQTPFYAEMGGQVGDSGLLQVELAKFEVINTLSFMSMTAHMGKCIKNTFSAGKTIKATINLERRQKIACNHTATHLLHWALVQVLGTHVKQTGSLVEEIRLRFDFYHAKALEPQQIQAIESLINKKIRENHLVKTYTMSYEEAKQNNTIKQFFGDKYGESVRVVDIGFSKELCGGCHVNRLGEIGFFKISKEGSIASGIRRIEAVTAVNAENWVLHKQDLLESIQATLKCPENKILEKIDAQIENNQALQKQIKKWTQLQLKQQVSHALKKVESIKGISFIGVEASITTKELASFADEIMNEIQSGIIAIGLRVDGRCHMFIKVSPDLVEKKIHANELIKEIAPIIEGGGGGKKLSAQAGGKKPSSIPSALSKLRQILQTL